MTTVSRHQVQRKPKTKHPAPMARHPSRVGQICFGDTAAKWVRSTSAFVKLQFEEGEVDFVAAPNLTDVAWKRWEIQGRPVRVETAAEVIAKKTYHRGDRATARDLFDLAMVAKREPDALAAAAPFLVRHRDWFLGQIWQPGAGFVATF